MNCSFGGTDASETCSARPASSASLSARTTGTGGAGRPAGRGMRRGVGRGVMRPASTSASPSRTGSTPRPGCRLGTSCSRTRWSSGWGTDRYPRAAGPRHSQPPPHPPPAVGVVMLDPGSAVGSAAIPGDVSLIRRTIPPGKRKHHPARGRMATRPPDSQEPVRDPFRFLRDQGTGMPPPRTGARRERVWRSGRLVGGDCLPAAVSSPSARRCTARR